MTEAGRILAHAPLATVGQDHTRPDRDHGLRHEDRERPLNSVVVIAVATVVVVVVWLAIIVVAIAHPGVKDHAGVLATVVTAVGHEVAVGAETGVRSGGSSR